MVLSPKTATEANSNCTVGNCISYVPKGTWQIDLGLQLPAAETDPASPERKYDIKKTIFLTSNHKIR